MTDSERLEELLRSLPPAPGRLVTSARELPGALGPGAAPDEEPDGDFEHFSAGWAPDDDTEDPIADGPFDDLHGAWGDDPGADP